MMMMVVVVMMMSSSITLYFIFETGFLTEASTYRLASLLSY
jgi:hypothetical protein